MFVRIEVVNLIIEQSRLTSCGVEGRNAGVLKAGPKFIGV
jgi:hypothetical protein